MIQGSLNAIEESEFNREIQFAPNQVAQSEEANCEGGCCRGQEMEVDIGNNTTFVSIGAYNNLANGYDNQSFAPTRCDQPMDIFDDQSFFNCQNSMLMQ